MYVYIYNLYIIHMYTYLYMHACVYWFMNMYIILYIYIYIYIYVYGYICKLTCAYAFMSVCAYSGSSLLVCIFCASVPLTYHIYSLMLLCVYVCLRMHILVCECVNALFSLYIHALYVCEYVCTCICILSS